MNKLVHNQSLAEKLISFRIYHCFIHLVMTETQDEQPVSTDVHRECKDAQPECTDAAGERSSDASNLPNTGRMTMFPPRQKINTYIFA